MQCHGFSEDSVNFYANLRNGGNSVEIYNDTKKVYYDKVLPELVAIFEKVSMGLSSHIPELKFDVTEDLGRPFAHVPMQFAWGAITRNGFTKHTDLQFFVALRFDYLRFGFYIPNKDRCQNIFGTIYRNIENNVDKFIELLEELESDGIVLSAKTANGESGKPKPLNFNAKYPQISILENSEFSLMSALPVEEIIDTDVSTKIIQCYERLIPMYKFILGLE